MDYPTTNLQPKQSGPEVKQLQEWLISQGYSIPAGATGYYGDQTKAAVTQLQQSLGVDPAGYPGYWGPRTLQKLQTQQTLQTTTPTNNLTPEQTQQIQSQITGITGQVSDLQAQQQALSQYGLQDTEQLAQDSSGNYAPATNLPEEYKTGIDIMDQILAQNKAFLDSLSASGQQVNPTIEITPEMTAQFLSQAKTELNPYYSSYIDSIKGDLQNDLNTLSEKYKLQKEDAIAQFKTSLGVQGENEATRGTIFSGGRTSRLGSLQESSQRSLESLQNAALSTAKTAGTTAERDIGSLGLSNLTSPSIETGRLSTLGEGQYQPISMSSLYQPTGGIYGTTTQNRTTAEQLRVAELEEAERKRRSLNFYQ